VNKAPPPKQEAKRPEQPGNKRVSPPKQEPPKAEPPRKKKTVLPKQDAATAQQSTQTTTPEQPVKKPVASSKKPEARPPANPTPAPAPAPAPAPGPKWAPPRTSVQPSRMKSSSGSWELEINWKKVGICAAIVLLLGVGVYYFFFLRGGTQRTYPVEGIVRYQGQPAVGARVTLFPEKKTRNSIFSTGVVKEDGSFKLTTYKTDDGCPVGKYQVTIIRGHLDKEKYDELSKTHSPEQIGQIAQAMTRDPLYEKYATPGTSGLKAEIKSSTNRLEYNLD
jgi:hypothetical protein